MSHSNRGDASFDLHEVFGASGWMEGEGLDRSYRNDQRDGDSGISGGLENSSGQNQLLHPWFNRSQSRSVTRSVSLGSGLISPFSVDFTDLRLDAVVMKSALATQHEGSWLRLHVLVTTFCDPSGSDENRRGEASKMLTLNEFAEFNEVTVETIYDGFLQLMKLTHPNLLLIMCASVTPAEPICFVSADPDGPSLQDFIVGRGGFLRPEEVVELATGIARGMLYLHSFDPSQLHGYLSASNTFFSKGSRQCRLSGFRIQFQRRPPMKALEEDNMRYMAPELLKGGDFSRAADQYAFGILLCIMWTGEIPYSLRSTEQIRDLVLQGERPPILSTDEMPLPMRQLISRCLHEDPEKRWSSFEKILEILRSPELERSIIVCTKSTTEYASTPVLIRGRKARMEEISDSFETFPLSEGVSSQRAEDYTFTPFFMEESITSELMIGAATGDEKRVLGLLEDGANVESRDYSNRTALHVAACEGHANVVQLLLEHGARVDVRDKWGSTPLHDAQNSGHYEAALILKVHKEKLTAVVDTKSHLSNPINIEKQRR